MAENLYYFDTQIWMDHYLKRGPNEIYGEQALALILKIIAEGSKVIFSNFNEKEMKDIGLSETEGRKRLQKIKRYCKF